MKKTLTLICFSLVISSAFSQKFLTLYEMKNIPQSVYANPAADPKCKFYLSLPVGMNMIGFSHSAFSLNDMFTKRADDSLQLNTQGIIDKLDKNNIISFRFNSELLGLGFKVGKIYANFNVTNKITGNFVYPKDLVQVLVEGNGKSFIGKRASFDGLGINFTGYTEFGFGASMPITDKLNVGARVKLLSGTMNLNTRKSELGLYTDPEDFSLTVDGSAEINSSNLVSLNNDSLSPVDPSNIFISAFNFANFGLGIDAGASYKLNDKVTVNASIIDFGYIGWKENVLSYKTNDFNYTYRGVNLNDYFNVADTNASDYFQNLQDSIAEAFSYDDNQDKYNTLLPAKIYLSANYQLTESFNGGIVLLNEFIKGKYNPAISLSANYNLKNIINLSLNYSIINKSYNNIGVGFSLKAGPIQFYAITDNILAFTNLYNAKNINIAFGISTWITKRDKKIKKGKGSES